MRAAISRRNSSSKFLEGNFKRIFACFALIALFWALFQADPFVVRWVQSHPFIGLEKIGQVGSFLGDGLVLAAMMVVLLVSGLWFRLSSFRHSGLQSLIALAAAGIAAQILKPLFGRLRPRLVPEGGFPFQGPTLESGHSSFPSGHATVSFAVAAVLAGHFPKYRWIFYGAATFVAVSRVFIRAHFPTDVLAGACLGILAGYFVVRFKKSEPAN